MGLLNAFYRRCITMDLRCLSDFFLSLQPKCLLVPIVLMITYMLPDVSIGLTSGMTLLVIFAHQQLFIVSKAWTRVFFFAGELSFSHGLQPFGEQSTLKASGIPSAQTTLV